METLKNQSREQITLIDAAALDDEQFNHLITSLDARHPIVPLLLTILVMIAGAGLIA